MNTYTLTVSTTKIQMNSEIVLGTAYLYNATRVTLNISDVYSDIFPNYVSIDWGDTSLRYKKEAPLSF